MAERRPLQPWQVLAGGVCGLVLTIGLARFAYTPLLPLMQSQTGLTDAGAGALAAANYAGYMTGAVWFAWVDDVKWRHRLYGLGLWLALLMTAAMAVSASPVWWALCRFLAGWCGATGMLLGSGLVLGWLMRQGQAPQLGPFFMGIGLSIVVTAVGSWMGNAMWPEWSSQWLAFAGMGLLFAVPAWRWRPPVPPVVITNAAVNASRMSRRWLMTLLLSYFAAGWGFVISATFTVAIVEREPALIGQGPWAWALVGLAAMPAVFVWDRVARLWGDKWALLMAFGLQTLAIILPAWSGSLWAALVGALGYGATFIGIVSMTLAWVGRRSPQNPGKAMARLTLSYGAAQILAPVVVGAMAQAAGSFHAGLWLTAGVMALGMLLLATLPED